VAAQSGNFQLNVMLPVIAHNLLWAIELSANAARLLADLGRRPDLEAGHETLRISF
jgi:fumarate hydratase class II